MNNNNENSKEKHSEALNIADVSRSCDCLIGRLCGDDVNVSNLKYELDETIRRQKSLDSFGLLNGKVETIKSLVDGRKGYLSRFIFCPYCGIKINWKALINNFC